MERLIVKFKQILLLVGDLITWYASLFIALQIRNALPRHATPVTWDQHVAPFTVLFALWVLIAYTSGLYDLTQAKNDATFFRRYSVNFAIDVAVALVFFYLLPFFGIEPRTTLLIMVAVAAALGTLWRLAAQSRLLSRALRTRVAFVGWNDEAAELDGLLKKYPNLGYDVVAVIRDRFDDLPSLLQQHRVNLVVLAMSPRTSPELARPLYESIYLKVAFTDCIPFYEQITGMVPVSAITRVWFLENLRESSKRFYDSVKRTADIVLAIVILAVTIIIGPFIALAIRLDSRGPALFRQRRVGKDGALFKIIKFRTMREDAEPEGAQWATRDDDRVTRVGRVLRLTRLDELPQVWNVFRGEMSFIGPRPERPEFVRELTAAMPFYTMRHLVRPGLTGWAQVNYGYAASITQNLRKLQYDLYYIKNRSPFVDLVILLRTIGTVLTAKGQ